MTNRRRTTQEAHERFTVKLFLENFNKWHRSNFKVISEPNPPEAVVQSGKTIRWVEVTTAYMNQEFAIDLNSYATDGEQYQPMTQHVFIGPDAHFAEQFVKVVKQKLEKQTYASIRDEYGLGYLIVSIQYPMFGRDSLRFISQAWSKVALKHANCFRSVYITYRVFDGYKVVLWKPK